MQSELPLAGIGVLVTRPAAQAQGLCNLIEQQGGLAIRVPTIEILPPHDIAPALVSIARLAEFDIAIFISVNAVTRGLALTTQYGPLPQQLEIAAVGKRTAQELVQKGYPPTIVPSHLFNSEGLLAAEPMQAVAGKNILIFRGEGGRELLADVLRQRGAHVQYAEVYRRIKPAQGLREAMHPWTVQHINAVVVTSNEGLQNFYDLALDEALLPSLLDIPLIVVSERASALAGELGFKNEPIIADDASDAAIVSALQKAIKMNVQH